MRVDVIGLLLLALSGGPAISSELAGSWRTAPFAVANPNPFILIHGLPATGPGLLQSGGSSLQLQLDLANNSIADEEKGESIVLDGESHRARLIWRHMLEAGWQIGIDLPLVAHKGGVLDSFIEDWHDLFGLSNSDRSPLPNNRLRFSYERNGSVEAELTDSASGAGDIQLLASRPLSGAVKGGTLTLNASLKLPTGDADKLLGSGAPELALWLSGSTPALIPSWRVGGFMHGGVLVMGEGDVLPELQHNAVMFGGFGAYWQVWEWLVLKGQLDAHSAFYESDLPQLGSASLMLTVGGTLLLDQGASAIDLAIGENLVTDTIPDFMINLAIKRRF